MRFLSLAAAAVLALLSARRALFALASLLPDPPPPHADGDEPSVVLLVAANDEAPTLSRLLPTIERLDWPRDRLHVVLVDDGSGDGTWEVMERWAAANANAHALRLEQRAGKSEALNAALAAAPPGEVIVCDADLRLAPDYLRRLVPAFVDPQVGAAAAFVTAANADASVVARYSALETWVHQLVTCAGKHRLGLNPATFAGSAYRRTALEAIGGFPGRSAGDDVGAAAALTRAGWRTSFVRGARADHLLAARVSDYWRQHIRWSRNVFEAARANGNGSRAARRRRLELGFAAVGYGDRLAFAGVLALAARRRVSPAVPASYAGLRLFEAVVAVVKAGESRRLPAYLSAAALALPLDVAASVAGLVSLRSPGPPAWRRARRPHASAALE